uniref:Uncharacterized protein n=1 Tax=Tetraselmis chuii TaxID=63592 RepID=A0A7S1X907_9CHLO
MDALLWDDADGSGRLAEGRNRAIDLTSPSLPLGVLVGLDAMHRSQSMQVLPRVTDKSSAAPLPDHTTSPPTTLSRSSCSLSDGRLSMDTNGELPELAAREELMDKTAAGDRLTLCCKDGKGEGGVSMGGLSTRERFGSYCFVCIAALVMFMLAVLQVQKHAAPSEPIRSVL